MLKRTTRRQFLQTTTAAGIGFWVAGGVRPAESKSPNEKIGFACVGTGGKGESDSADAGRSGDMVAICDTDEDRLNAAGTRFPKAKKFVDFRKMLEEMHKEIDAVTVSTPDHTHAPAALMAMRMGKHCFVQKPMTRTIYEARLLGQVAREKEVATQMGNQYTAFPPLRKAAALLRGGIVGTVKEVHVWTNRPIWDQGQPRPPEEPAPKNLKWDLWLGPAPMRPYGKGYHPFAWRGWWDFGTGALGDMACHTVNMPFMGLNLRNPTSVQATTSGHNKDSYPNWSIIRFEFPAIDNRPALRFWWYDGKKRPARDLFDSELLQDGSGKKKPMSGSGCLILGDKGKLYAPGDYAEQGLRLSKGLTPPEVQFPESPGHFAEWTQAIKGGPAAMSNFPDYASPLTETILLGNLAVWAASEPGEGKKIEWDAKELKPTNAPEVQHIVKPTYREGYTLDV